MIETVRRRFDRHEWVPVTVGKSGAGVWRLDGSPPLYAKAAPRSEHPDAGFDVAGEADRLDWLGAHGIPAAHVVDTGEKDGVAWLVSTAVPGRTAAEDWASGEREAVVDAVADFTRVLHALPVADCPFDRSLAVTVPHARYAAENGLVDLEDLDDERSGWSAARLVTELDGALPGVEESVVCHGDLCLPNVLLDPSTFEVTGLIDVGRLGVADRYADLALITRSLRAGDLNPQFGARFADRFLARYGEVPVDTTRLDFYRLLDEFF
ncbi:APH(3') family aminoglycoside O-phosphotransferase [Amycolatopsis sp. CA-230715]|uniref:APH(3') family aminoglycoside O-phosphotransferase n=1 Tax=Amycolatopsis sp. CA-230715 TaxID=2745196 RepID=UPI001C00FF2D|nr:APH(3') family aminoglycoside O-phosphotransferase [Amycolatopsis sp. CA-230715]QWF80324.1 Aminoglycoside 3'-phosphotransferase [Amycolatopsis sp. CA-230715]